MFVFLFVCLYTYGIAVVIFYDLPKVIAYFFFFNWVEHICKARQSTSLPVNYGERNSMVWQMHTHTHVFICKGEIRGC